MMGFALQYGVSSLGAASNNGHLDVVKTLIEAGANIDQAPKVSQCTCYARSIDLRDPSIALRHRWIH